MAEFGNISEAISKGKKAYDNSDFGPVITSEVNFASLSFSNSDFGAVSYLDAIRNSDNFVWGLDAWGSTEQKVGE